MKRTFLLVALIAAGCASSNKPAATDDFAELASLDEKSDAFSSRMKIVGDLQNGDTQQVKYTDAPRYRAYRIVGKKGQKVSVWVRSSTGDALAWLLSSSYRILAKNDD